MSFLFPKIMGCYFSLKISTCYKYAIMTSLITYKTMIWQYDNYITSVDNTLNFSLFILNGSDSEIPEDFLIFL